MKRASTVSAYLLYLTLARSLSNTSMTSVSPRHANPPCEKRHGVPCLCHVILSRNRSDVLTASLITSPGSSRRALFEYCFPLPSRAVTVTSSNTYGDRFLTSNCEMPRISRPQLVFQSTTAAVPTAISTMQIDINSHGFFIVKLLPSFTAGTRPSTAKTL